MRTIKILVALLFMSYPFFPISAQESDGNIKWLSFEEAVKMNKQQPKKFMVYVYSNNCGWCRKMENETFSDSVIVDYIKHHYYPVKINKNIKKKIHYDNRSFSFLPANPANNTGGYHELIAILLQGRLAFPSIAYMDEDMVYLGVDRGYKSVPSFLERLKLIGNGEF